ncbi:MAG: hypothetical protein ISS72_11640 [Candidatus Brocadiae bacterium]|nr:hypothetical protein [Candidatus Brocadiia bacterium]
MAAPLEQPSPNRRAAERIVLVALVLAFVGVSWWRCNPYGDTTRPLTESYGIIIAAGLTLIMYSFLYRDNPLFKMAENLYVGVALGYGAIITWRQSLRPEVVDPLFRAPTAEAFYAELGRRFVPIVLGLLLVTRISRTRGWLSRYAIALMVGWGAGMGIPIVTHSYILQQLQAAVSPLQATVQAGQPAAFFTQAWFVSAALPVMGAVLVLVGTVSVLFYFFFSVEHKGAGGVVSRVGIWFLMVSFGASFGYTVMGRLSLLIGRVRFLLFEWLSVQP